MKKVIHIITGLNNGGAEAVLYRLCTSDKKCEYIVISLMDEGKYGPLLENSGIKVYCLNMPQGKVTINGLWKLFKITREQKPDIVQTWMYHGDFIGGIAAKLAGAKNIFWNVRNSTLESGKSKRSTIVITKICAFFSKFIPKKIIYCAKKAKEVHEAIGYEKDKTVIINNGYDLKKFYFDENKRKDFRSEIGIKDDENLIGMVARFDPQKDHLNLINAMRLVKKEGFDFKLILVGKDMDKNNQTILENIKKNQLINDTILLGQQSDIPMVMNGLDLHILSSSAEAFPNVVAEAMACETPCVATDVGDAKLIVGKTGWIVPPKNSKSLADAIIEALKEKQNYPKKWLERKKACRDRIVENFSIEKMIENYHRVWFEE